MATKEENPSRGPVAVGLLALHDREFFEYLLREPHKAMEQKVKEGKLKLTPADVDRVAGLIKRHLTARPQPQPMKMWERYRKTGLFVDGEDWMELWKEG